MTVALTQTDLDALDAAIATGELSVTYDGKTVMYRSIDDLIKAREYVRSKLQSSPATRISLATSSKGV